MACLRVYPFFQLGWVCRTSAYVVINPFDASGAPTLPDGVTLTFAVTLTDLNTGLTGQASVDVSRC